MSTTTTHHDFSVAWGRNGSATRDFCPYQDDAEAKAYRDAFAATMRKEGHKVRRSTLRGQRREFWGWQDPCGITCTVYVVTVEASAALQQLGA